MNQGDAFRWRLAEADRNDEERKPHAERLRSCGIAPTPQRLDVAGVLFERGGHFTADQVFSTLNEQLRGVSRATVYNTLNLFADRGLLKSLVLERDCVLYDTNIAPHHHMVDPSRNLLVDIPGDAIKVAALPDLPAGTRLDGVEIIVRVCGEGA